MTTSSEVAITNLLYRYAEMVDPGRFEELGGELFAHARFVIAPPPAEPVDGQAMSDLMCHTTIRHADGTPRTKHVVTNPIIDIDEETGTATCRSTYLVIQQTDRVAMQPIVVGRYHDRFARIDGKWCFTERDYTLVDLVGDVSDHLLIQPPTTKAAPWRA